MYQGKPCNPLKKFIHQKLIHNIKYKKLIKTYHGVIVIKKWIKVISIDVQQIYYTSDARKIDCSNSSRALWGCKS